MKNRFFCRRAFVLVLSVAGLSCARQTEEQRAPQGPSIEGTYKLVERELQDGTRQTAPDVMGMLTYTKTSRNFNVLWKDAKGKFFSYSIVSTYNLTPTEYSETLLYSILNDQIGGKEIVYNLSGETRTAPVTIENGRIKMKLPFDPPSVVFAGDSLTATAEGVFVDHWERVE